MNVRSRRSDTEKLMSIRRGGEVILIHDLNSKVLTLYAQEAIYRRTSGFEHAGGLRRMSSGLL